MGLDIFLYIIFLISLLLVSYDNSDSFMVYILLAKTSSVICLVCSYYYVFRWWECSAGRSRSPYAHGWRWDIVQKATVLLSSFLSLFFCFFCTYTDVYNKQIIIIIVRWQTKVADFLEQSGFRKNAPFKTIFTLHWARWYRCLTAL